MHVFDSYETLTIEINKINKNYEYLSKFNGKHFLMNIIIEW